MAQMHEVGGSSKSVQYLYTPVWRIRRRDGVPWRRTGNPDGEVGVYKYLGSVGRTGGRGCMRRDLLLVMLTWPPIRMRAAYTTSATCSLWPDGAGEHMSSTYAEKGMPRRSKTHRGISKTTTNKKKERGQPYLTPCVLLNTVPSAPRRNVDSCSITREIICSNLEGVPIRSSTPRISVLGGLSKAW